jgi:RNA polymerase sigma-70 factor, ECF subfamily
MVALRSMNQARAQTDESAMRSAWSAGDARAAVRLILDAYGREVFGFLVVLQGDADAADDAFSLFAERLWQSLPKFEWRCSVRTWVYLLARNASAEVRRGRARRDRREVPIPEDSQASELAVRICTQTLSELRTERRTALQLLRDELPQEDRMLLVLRVDRRLAWRDVARVFLSAERSDDERALEQESARLRKRFQLVRERLVAAGKKRGLI